MWWPQRSLHDSIKTVNVAPATGAGDCTVRRAIAENARRVSTFGSGCRLASPRGMAAICLVLFLVTFLFDTRIGLAFLILSIALFYRGGAARRLKQTRAAQPAPPQGSWKDPWGTGQSQS